MIRFAHGELLPLLWLVPVLLLVAWLEYLWRLKAMKTWADTTLWDAALPQRAPGRLLIKRGLAVCAMGLIVFALCGPQVGTRLTEIKREGTDLVIALDVSQSMNAADIEPSRIIKAKNEITRLLGKLHGDRVALVPFAQVAFVQVPLTLDYSAVVTSLNAVSSNLIPYPGTSLGAAIKQSRKAFRAESAAQKILILITDSEDHDSEPIEEAKAAAEEGIRIYTVGMATPQGGPIPILDDRGRISGYKQYKNTTVVSKLNEALLIELAEITGGEYFRATKTGREFANILERIMGSKTEEFESKQYTDYEDRFQWPISAAIILIVIEQFLPPGRRRRK